MYYSNAMANASLDYMMIDDIINWWHHNWHVVLYDKNDEKILGFFFLIFKTNYKFFTVD